MGDEITDLKAIGQMTIEKEDRLITIEQAWLTLASDVLLLAIEDARQTRDKPRSEKAKRWLLSPAARLFFESFDFELDIQSWVLAGCPNLGKQWTKRRHPHRN